MLVTIFLLFVLLHGFITGHLSGRYSFGKTSRVFWFIASLVPPLFYLFLIRITFFSETAVINTQTAHDEDVLLEPFKNI